MTRKDKRRISETMDSIMMPLIPHLDEQTKEVVRQALRILRDNNAIKTLEQEPKTGHWIICLTNADTFHHCECSECSSWAGEITDYCPNCGIKMVEPQESEET